MKPALAAAVLLAVLAGCAAAPKRAAADSRAAKAKPEWVDGQSSEYPRDMYLSGVGLGDDRQSAEDRARGEISKVLSTVVSVDTNLTETEGNENKNGAATNDFRQNISQ